MNVWVCLPILLAARQLSACVPLLLATKTIGNGLSHHAKFEDFWSINYFIKVRSYNSAEYCYIIHHNRYRTILVQHCNFTDLFYSYNIQREQKVSLDMQKMIRFIDGRISCSTRNIQIIFHDMDKEWVYFPVLLITDRHYTNIPFSATGLSAGVLSRQDLIATQCPVFRY